MRVLAIEDNDEKYNAIEGVIQTDLSDKSLELLRASTMREATKQLYEQKYDLIIVDLMLPSRTGDNPQDISNEILETISESQLNNASPAIALTSFQQLVEGCITQFNEANIPVVHFESSDERWKSALSRELLSISNASLFEFVIVCALEKERNAFTYTNAQIGEKRLLRGLDCLDISLGERKGLIVKPPRMGMTDTAIISTRVLDEFKPSIICMSGICAGIPGEAEIGDVIIAENCFDYQVGKWTEEGFRFEMYQTAIDEESRVLLEQNVISDQIGQSIRHNLGFPELKNRKIALVTHASGSAVVAEEGRRKEIEKQHRKVASVEMEIFSLYRAASICTHKPKFFAAKGVVDDAGSSKGDLYHEYGAITSARLVVSALQHIMGA